jgi:membrane protein DedA with SNARE-associated domain
MEEFVDSIVDTLAELNPAWTYAALIISAFLENVIPPVPGDTVVVFSAYLVGRGSLQFLPVYLANCIGGITGFMVMYYLGLTRGRALLEGPGRRYFSQERVERAEEWLARYGILLVLANRFLSGIRSVIAIAAGLAGMRSRRVFIWGLVSVALWNALLLWAGILVGQNWRQILVYLKTYNWILLGLGGIVVGIWALKKLVRSRREPVS